MKKVKSVPTRNLQEYFEHRLEYKINVYTKLGMRFKWIFWITTSISMICAAVVPALINNDCKHLATILSLIVTIMVGFQGVFRPREHWRNYDKVSATIRCEEMLFSTKSGIYQKIESDEARFQLFVRRVEEFISREREETIIMRTTEQENK